MKNPIKKLEITNFKTVKNVSLECKRINIIIGKPNVGKSNILEAISLLSAFYSKIPNKYLSEFIRYEYFEDLFYDKETANSIHLKSNIGQCEISHDYQSNVFKFILARTTKELTEIKNANSPFQMIDDLVEGHHKSKVVFNKEVAPCFYQISNTGQTTNSIPSWSSPVKKYDFKPYNTFYNRFHHFLAPPFGDNLFAVINTNKKMFREIASIFKEYKLDFVMDVNASKFALQKKVNGVIYTNDYNLIADTLQRYIFNLMAIESNKESILLFEEPEAHMFPPYAKGFASKVIESIDNQFFITTHSPFVLNTIIENAPLSDVAVFVTSYEKFQTKVKLLTQSELEDMLNYGNDIFFSEQLNG